jgi:hypothetical protein
MGGNAGMARYELVNCVRIHEAVGHERRCCHALFAIPAADETIFRKSPGAACLGSHKITAISLGLRVGRPG